MPCRSRAAVRAGPHAHDARKGLDAGNVLVAGGASHTSRSFGPLQAHFLQITIDASNLVGDERQLIGVDNIRLQQIERASPVVETPGPFTLILLGAGLAAVQIGRRRR